MDKKQAWNYAIGMIKVDGLKPTDDFMNLAQKEIDVNITTKDIEEALFNQRNISLKPIGIDDTQKNLGGNISIARVVDFLHRYSNILY